ncbi:NAD-dependent protein deacylase [Parvibacter caecicola]|uniref:NAD-dependent protein deacetylase n=1 Tax=Parvibacter caecicola TaxID=747645 RepID=A0A7W5D350_9ACTN|nr:NAD-dependent protein deacylase [Parvibacter caecicola]MBB3171295.1 NAD-dependent deacetylase [Parvibacter caecicola]MCR2041173.1 NAD-dependent protein deacylase [Parvibacter caecicola]RNL11637.1 NAD-dependent protein deacylase [Parvibacter caecicola]
MTAPADQRTADDIATLRSWIESCGPGGMVFFGGAGVSTESGIPDFRSTGGLYSQKYSYPPETMVSHSFFEAHPQEFFQFYFDRMIAPEAKPNQAHKKLAELEQRGVCRAVVTQNIDGLHQVADSRNVYELHGSVHRNYCTGCKRFFNLEETMQLHQAATDGVPRCPDCDAIVKPDVVLYEEPLDEEVITGAVQAIAQAELLVVAGTSLVVYPAAGLLRYFQGDKLAIVNLSPTSADKSADLCINAKVGEVFGW